MTGVSFGHNSDTDTAPKAERGTPITDKMVRKLSPAHTTRIFYDHQIHGFGVRVTPGGAISFVLNYCIHGRERRYTIGRFPEISALAAREEALRLRAEIHNGHDPLAERERVRSIPTLADFSDVYLQRHAEPNKSPYSVRDDKRLLGSIIKPRLGKLPLNSISRADIEALHRDFAATPVQANRVLTLLHTLFEKAMEWEYIGSDLANPAENVKHYPEEPRRRWAQEEELSRLLKTLDQLKEKDQADALRLITLTGSRKGEVLSATWDQFDLDRGTWTKPSHSTKQKRTETVPLGESAIKLLRTMKRSQTSTWLFPGKDGNHRKDLKKVWAKVIKAAELADFNIHDLRHTFASHLVSGGAPLALVGALLGHTQARTTQRYAHLADGALRQVSNQFGKIYKKSRARKVKT